MPFTAVRAKSVSHSAQQFFADVKEAEAKMKKIQETMKKKYICDRSITVTRLEDLLQDAAVGTLRLHVIVKRIFMTCPLHWELGHSRIWTLNFPINITESSLLRHHWPNQQFYIYIA